jgi:hypothetical protein
VEFQISSLLIVVSLAQKFLSTFFLHPLFLLYFSIFNAIHREFVENERKFARCDASHYCTLVRSQVLELTRNTQKFAAQIKNLSFFRSWTPKFEISKELGNDSWKFLNFYAFVFPNLLPEIPQILLKNIYS